MARNTQQEEPEFVYLDTQNAEPISPTAVTVMKDVFCELTLEERADKSDRLVKLEVQKEAQTLHKKETQDALRKGLRETTDEIEKVVKALDIGKEKRELDVLVDYDNEQQEVRTYHPETRQCIERREFTVEETKNPMMA